MNCQQLEPLSMPADQYVFYNQPNQPNTLIILNSYNQVATLFNNAKLLLLIDSQDNPIQLPLVAAQLQTLLTVTIEYGHENNVQQIISICQNKNYASYDVYLLYSGLNINSFKLKLQNQIKINVKFLNLSSIRAHLSGQSNPLNGDQIKYKRICEMLQLNLRDNINIERVKLYTQNDKTRIILKAMLQQKFNYQKSIEHLRNLAQKIISVDNKFGFTQQKIWEFYTNNKDVFLSQTRALKEYTNQSFVYRLLNNLLRCSQSPLDLYYILPICQGLFHKIKSLYKQRNSYPKFQKYYRGCFLSDAQIQLFTNNIGYYVQMTGFLSTSRNKEIAQNFASNVLLVIEVVKPISGFQSDSQFGYALVQHFSEFSYEQEVLFNILNIFRVQRVQRTERYFQITLMYGFESDLVSENSKSSIISSQSGCQNIISQGDLLYFLKDDNQLFLHAAYAYWKKKMEILNNLNGISKELTFNRIQVLRKLLELEIKTKRYSQVVQEINLFNQKLQQCLENSRFQFKQGWGMQLKQINLMKEISIQLSKIQRQVFQECFFSINNFISRATLFFKSHRKKCSNEFQALMKNYCQLESNHLMSLAMQDEYVHISAPRRSESLLIIKNIKLIQQLISRTFLYNNIACLSHRLSQIQHYCMRMEMCDRIVEIPDVKQLEQNFQVNKYQVITCTKINVFVNILKSKIFAQPGKFTVIYFAQDEKSQQNQRKQRRISDVIELQYLNKPIKIIVGYDFKFDVHQAAPSSFLISSQSPLYCQNGLHFHLVFSAILKQKTQKMKMFELFVELAKFQFAKESRYDQNKVEYMFDDLRKQKYEFKKQKAIKLLTSSSILQKCLQVLHIKESTNTLFYCSSALNQINAQINEGSQKMKNNKSFTVYTCLQLSSEQISAFANSKFKFVQNKRLLLCSSLYEQPYYDENNITIEIKVPSRKRKNKKLANYGNYCFTQQIRLGLYYESEKVIFNLLCTFKIEQKTKKEKNVINLTYIEPDDFYCLPNQEQQFIFLIEWFYQMDLCYKVQHTLNHARANNINTQGQIYSNLIPDEEYKNIQKDEMKYWQHMHDLCWLEWIDKNNFSSQLKKASQLLNAITHKIELSLKTNQLMKQSFQMAELLEERVDLISLSLQIFKVTSGVVNQMRDKLWFVKNMGEFVLAKKKLKQKLLKLPKQFRKPLKIDKHQNIVEERFIECLVKGIQNLTYWSIISHEKTTFEKDLQLSAIRFLRDWLLAKQQEGDKPIESFIRVYQCSKNLDKYIPKNDQIYPNIFRQFENEIDSSFEIVIEQETNLDSAQGCQNNECCENLENLQTDSSNMDEGDTQKYLYDFLTQTVSIVHIKTISSLMGFTRFLFNYNCFLLNRIEKQASEQKQVGSIKQIRGQKWKSEEIQMINTTNSVYSALTESFQTDNTRTQLNYSAKIEQETEPSQIQHTFTQFSTVDSYKQEKKFKKKQRQHLFKLDEHPWFEDQQGLESSYNERNKKYKQLYRNQYVLWSYLNRNFYQTFKEHRKLEFTYQKVVQKLQYEQFKECIQQYVGEAINLVQKLGLYVDECYEKVMTEYLREMIKQIEDQSGLSYPFEEPGFQEFLKILKERMEQNNFQILLPKYNKITQPELQISVNEINKLIKEQNRRFIKWYRETEQNYLESFQVMRKIHNQKDRLKLFYISRHLRKLKSQLHSMSMVGVDPKDIGRSLDKIYKQIFMFRDFSRSLAKVKQKRTS